MRVGMHEMHVLRVRCFIQDKESNSPPGFGWAQAVEKPILREVPWLSLWESCHA